MASELSSTPPAEEDTFVPGSRLWSGTTDYLVVSLMGQGTFGKVVNCLRMDNCKPVAIKVIMNEDSYFAQREGGHFPTIFGTMLCTMVANLQKLSTLDSDMCNLVHFDQVFIDKGHFCLEFELLDKSLYDLMKESYFRPLRLNAIRPIIHQIATALYHLKSLGIIHADLKLDNVMLVNHQQAPYRVKVIDFGLACNASNAIQGSYVQNRHYRSPEIILGLPFTEAIDMWSLGCIAAILYLGSTLYPGTNEYDMMRYIVETQGQPPDNLLNNGRKTSRFFKKKYTSTTRTWKLRTRDKFFQKTGILPKECRNIKLTSLDDFLILRVISAEDPEVEVSEMCDVLFFVDMLKEMLQLDAANRLTPSQLLQHHFISMPHLVCMSPISPQWKDSLSRSIQSCINKINIKKAPTSDSGTAVCRSLEQPSSRTTTKPVQQNRPPSPAQRSSLEKPHSVNPHPCTSAQTTSSVRSGVKRKLENEDENKSGTSHQSKRAKTEVLECQHGGSSKSSQACSTTSPVSHGVKRNISDDFKMSDPAKKRPRCSTSPSPSRPSYSTQSCISPSLERKTAPGEESYNHKRSHKRVRQSCESSSSLNSTHTLHGQPDRKDNSAERLPHFEAGSQVRSGLKRKTADDEDGCRHRERPCKRVHLEEDSRSKEPYVSERRRSNQETHDHSHTPSFNAARSH